MTREWYDSELINSGSVAITDTHTLIGIFKATGITGFITSPSDQVQNKYDKNVNH